MISTTGAAIEGGVHFPIRPDEPLIAREISVGGVRELLSGNSTEHLASRATTSWERRREGLHLLGFGDAIRIRGARDSTIAEAVAGLKVARGAVLAETSVAGRPRFFGGARFRPGGRIQFDGWESFGGWQFVMPRLLVSIEKDSATATVVATERELREQTLEDLARSALNEAPQATPDVSGHLPESDMEHWAGRVALAVAEIGDGRYDKVVLAVHRDVYAGRTLDQGQLLAALAARYPDCYTFKFVSDGAAWLGASPELLAANAGGQVHAASLAGSRPRGRSVGDDDELAHELMASEKERVEHRLVVEALASSLGTVCTNIDVPAEPRIMRMANIQHLHTPVRATLLPGRDILDLVAAVHPTPAVGGFPREPAIEAIERLEGIDRGWYAAPIGWLDLNGDGEFAVALRSGLVRGNRADLFAGCGIVPGSIPAAEVAEVEQKLRALGDTIKALEA